ncbi:MULTISPECIES: DUF3325 domain-containing protein [unclassified Pseudoalteromonas]|uniref:DUF3325 domain-containing protein n=1 Tax=unclassified Pseudoalteromonas TaxID=194690 RepID=UPI0018CF0D1A|nr:MULTISPECIES: DUF3325 domain-containing protein [unclassified Pseudoalteromonas]MBH0011493.1 DUF3325 domain-containing protein [Pseudoalteromonas sp. NZS100_1]MBH0041177.1 DUF3325 domain-containing protein [Pseudoalteromonas sp. SWXJZ10B]
MIDLLGFSLCLFGFNGFALAKFNHFKDVFKKRPTELQSKSLLFIAWISILLSLVLCVTTQSGYGALLFCGFMSLSVLIIMVFYNFLVGYVKWFSVLNSVLVVLSGLFLALN